MSAGLKATACFAAKSSLFWRVLYLWVSKGPSLTGETCSLSLSEIVDMVMCLVEEVSCYWVLFSVSCPCLFSRGDVRGISGTAVLMLGSIFSVCIFKSLLEANTALPGGNL